jgi:hypothetical protein
MSLFSSIEVAEEMMLPVMVDACGPSAHGFGPRCTKEPAFTILAGSAFILPVGSIGNITEVEKPVIRPLAVDVVNVAIGPFAMGQRPSKAMGLEKSPGFNADADIAVHQVPDASEDFAGLWVKTEFLS